MSQATSLRGCRASSPIQFLLASQCLCRVGQRDRVRFFSLSIRHSQIPARQPLSSSHCLQLHSPYTKRDEPEAKDGPVQACWSSHAASILPDGRALWVSLE